MNRPSITIGLFLHSHQPVGNYDWVFEQNWDRAYRPMLEALMRHPTVHATLHYSGPLIDWLTEHKPEFDEMLRELVGREQVELAGAGYYEPILAMIPEADRQGQIRLMANELKRRWGTRMDGAWLTERVWEPHLAASLARAGVGYTLVDDAHFDGIGIPDEQLDGYYLTEDEGLPLAVFPGVRLLRNSMPWRKVPGVISMLRREARRGPGRLLVMGDDGEKFGAWPGTYQSCWGRGAWVEKFFTALEENSDWLQTTTLTAWKVSNPPKGTVYFPTASYHEMEEWALPAEGQLEQRRFARAVEEAGIDPQPPRAGYWRNFFVKYPESAAMRHRIFRVRALIDELPPGQERDAAERLLWKGENNCPYWHGIFGGVYLQNIRTITTAHLVEAEARAVAASGQPLPWARSEDVDMDGRPELCLRTAHQQVVIDPAEGGAIVEWDLVGQAWPLTTVVARRPEAYHNDLQAGASISPGVGGGKIQVDGSLVYDPARRVALQERILSPRTTYDAWTAGLRDVADLRTLQWEADRPRRTGRSASASLSTEADGLSVTKRVRLPSDGADLGVEYRLANTGDRRVSATFVSEWNLNLPAGGNGREARSSLPDHVHDSAGGWLSGSPALRLDYRLAGFDEAWVMPVETVSSSEAGLNLSYQGFCVGFAARIALEPGEEAQLSLDWSPTEPGGAR